MYIVLYYNRTYYRAELQLFPRGRTTKLSKPRAHNNKIISQEKVNNPYYYYHPTSALCGAQGVNRILVDHLLREHVYKRRVYAYACVCTIQQLFLDTTHHSRRSFSEFIYI